MESELDCWMEWIENTMADAAYDQPMEDDDERYIGGQFLLMLGYSQNNYLTSVQHHFAMRNDMKSYRLLEVTNENHI